MTDDASPADPLRVPAGNILGGTLHDWMNTGIGTLAALLYLAHCAGFHPF